MKIILVFKTHFDIGFTDYSRNVIAQYQSRMLPEVIETCRKTADMSELKYVWTMPAWPLARMQENSACRADLDRLIADGQIAWHALPYTLHTDFSGTEDIIQSLHYAADLAKEYHVAPPISAKMTDVPGHGRILPTILASAGIRFLHLGCNAFATPPRVPPLFFWEGVDGNRVLTMYGAGGYGSQLLPPDDWPYPVWMALMHTHDNSGPQSADTIRCMVAEIRRLCPDAQVICGTMDDFYHELEQFDLSSLPVIDQDLADTWIHGAGTYPTEVRAIRQARREILSANAAAFITHAVPDAVQALSRQAFDALALFDEHTWGMDVKTFLKPNRVYRKDLFLRALETDEYRNIQASWDEQRQRATAGASFAVQALRAVETSSQRSVLNPNGTPFTGWADTQEGTPGSVAFPDGYKLFVRQIPPFSAAPLPVAEQVLPPATGGLENHRYRLTLDFQQGMITELYDKYLGRALLRQRDGIGVFSYRYDIYGIQEQTDYIRDYGYRFFDWGIRDNLKDNYPEIPHQILAPRFLNMEQRGYTVILHYQGSGCSAYGDAEEIRVEVTLPPLGEELFVQVRLDRKQMTPFSESGSIAFPLADDTPAFRLNKNGDFLDPSREIADQANHALYCVEEFLCAQSHAHGLCLLSKDAPLFSIGETGMFTYRRQYEPHAPILYCNLFNNMWGTNFPQWMGGDYTFRFLLFGYTGTADGRLYAKALSLAQGAQVLSVQPGCSPLQLPDGIQPMGVFHEGDAVIVHLRDTKWEQRTITVRYPGKKITPVDLRGTPLAPASPDTACALLRPFGIAAFRFD